MRTDHSSLCSPVLLSKGLRWTPEGSAWAMRDCRWVSISDAAWVVQCPGVPLPKHPVPLVLAPRPRPAIPQAQHQQFQSLFALLPHITEWNSAVARKHLFPVALAYPLPVAGRVSCARFLRHTNGRKLLVSNAGAGADACGFAVVDVHYGAAAHGPAARVERCERHGFARGPGSAAVMQFQDAGMGAVVAVLADSTVRTLDLRTRSEGAVAHLGEHMGTCCAVGPGGLSSVYLGTRGGCVCLYDLRHTRQAVQWRPTGVRACAAEGGSGAAPLLLLRGSRRAVCAGGLGSCGTWPLPPACPAPSCSAQSSPIADQSNSSGNLVHSNPCVPGDPSRLTQGVAWCSLIKSGRVQCNPIQCNSVHSTPIQTRCSLAPSC